jgi:hypothetical protein
LVAELKTLTDSSKELLIVAFIPEIVAVASGFELAQQGVRFFAGRVIGCTGLATAHPYSAAPER